MSMRDKFPDQPEQLFDISQPVPNYEGRETDFSTQDRLENLIQTLDTFDRLAEVQNLISRFRNKTWLAEQEQALGKNVLYKWRRQKYEEHQQLQDTAKLTFAKAYPLSHFEGAGDTEQAQAALDRHYGIFEQAYRGTSAGRFKKRAETRAEYQAYLEEKRANTEEESSDTVTQALAHTLGANVVQHAIEPELAQTKDKLIGLRDDNRAGFLPTTHTEKNQAFEMLDYMSQPEGPTKRLHEIFVHQMKIAHKNGIKGRDIYDYAVDAIRSVTQEWADHLQNAKRSYTQLIELQELLDSGISPRISTSEAVETDLDQSYDYNALIRFMTLAKLRLGETEHLGFDPLRTKQDRSILHTHKNKIIEDTHTATGSLIDIQDYIDTAAEELSVKDARTILTVAIADQAARRSFWLDTLRAVAEYQQEGFQTYAQDALRAAGE